MKVIGFIYITINKINNKKYIGQHTKFEDQYLSSGKILQLAIKKYGRNNFKRIILDYAETQEELNKKEKYYISYYNAVKSNEFYNIHEGGQGGDTYSGKNEQEKMNFKKKMSKITKGAKNGMFGKHHNSYSINNMKLNWDKSGERRKYYSSVKFKEKMSKVTKGKHNGIYGKNHSKDSKRKMSENSLGKNCGKDNGMYGMKGNKALNGKKIYQYIDKDKKILVNKFNSVQCVLSYLNIKGHSALYKALKQGSKYKDYYWSKEKKV